jgi:hypothetical protein
MSDKDTGCGSWGCMIVIALVVLYGIVQAIAFAARAYAKSFRAGDAALGALLGGLAGGALAAGMGALWGNHRRKAEVGPLPMFRYLASSATLHKLISPPKLEEATTEQKK